MLLCYFSSKWQQKSKQALTLSNLPFSPIFIPNATFVNRPSSLSQDNLHITTAMRTTLSYTSTAWHELLSTWLHVKINCGALKIPMLKQHPLSEFGACLTAFQASLSDSRVCSRLRTTTVEYLSILKHELSSRMTNSQLSQF